MSYKTFEGKTITQQFEGRGLGKKGDMGRWDEGEELLVGESTLLRGHVLLQKFYSITLVFILVLLMSILELLESDAILTGRGRPEGGVVASARPSFS